MRAGRIASALERPASVNGIVFGEPVDVLLDRQLTTALGLQVHCRDGLDRFLPWPVGELAPDGVTVERPLGILEAGELEYYRQRSLGLSELRRLPVVERGLDVGRVADVVVDAEGHVLSIVLVDVRGERAIERSRLEVGLERVRLVAESNGSRAGMFPSRD